MAQHKHNRPCAHRHSDLWLPSKAHKPVAVTHALCARHVLIRTQNRYILSLLFKTMKKEAV